MLKDFVVMEDAPAIPHNREAEEAVVGAVLINPEVYYDVAQFLSADDFYIHRNKWAWEAFDALIQKSIPIDMLTVSEELDRKNQLQEIGGPAYLTSLINQVPTSLNAESYGRIVEGHAIRRRMINAANNIASRAYDERQDVTQLMADASNEIIRVNERHSSTSKKNGSEILGSLYEDLYEAKTPLTFGVGDLDERLGGMFGGELTSIGGDQGTGKSSFMLWIARRNAEKGKRSLIVSLEMKAKNLYARMACGDLGVNWNQVRAGRVSEENKLAVWNKVQELEERYRDVFTIYEDPMTLASIQGAAVKEQADIVLIDHVSLISGMRETKNTIERIDQLNGITRFLRQNIAKPLNAHVVLLWQLTRSAFKEKRRPTKHDLFMAGTQDPDSILLLYRPDLYNDDEQFVIPTKPVDLEVIVGKARNDFSGIVPLKYDLAHQKFGGLSRIDSEAK